MRVLFLCARVHVGAGAGAAWAQPGATGPVATLNAEAKSLSETDPDRSLALAQEALAAAREAQDVRGQAEAHTDSAYGYRNQSLLDVARQSAEESVRLYTQVQDRRGQAQGNDRAVDDHWLQHQAARDVMFKQENAARRGRAQRRPVHSQHLPVVFRGALSGTRA